MKRHIYLLITIDTECDKGPDWKLQCPLRFSSVTRGIPERLMPLFRNYQVKPTFLVSPEVLQDDASVAVLSGLRNSELGTHLHGEFVPPCDQPGTGRTSMPQFLYDPDIEKQKLFNLTGMFESKFGFRPTSFRAGRFGISPFSLRILAELGYLVDSSVTPFWTHEYEGRGTRNYWGAPMQPYFPDWSEPRKLGNASILEVPVTIINSFLARWPKWILRRMDNHTRLHARVWRRVTGKNIPKTLWLRPQRSSLEEMKSLVDQAVRISSHSMPVVLNMMYHSVEIMAGASPYAQTEADVEAILESQSCLFGYLQEKYSVQSVGLSDLYRVFLESSYASHS